MGYATLGTNCPQTVKTQEQKLPRTGVQVLVKGTLQPAGKGFGRFIVLFKNKEHHPLSCQSFFFLSAFEENDMIMTIMTMTTMKR